MEFNQEMLEGGCGVNNIFDFVSVEWGYRDYTDAVHLRLGGAGLAIACFIDNAECKEMYAALAAKFKISFQSVPRRNANSGRQFFMCVYEAK